MDNPGTPNLEAWWTEDVDGTDSHGANNLTEVAAPSHVAGKVGNAVDLEKDSAQSQKIVDNASLSFGNEDLSFGCWVKLESKNTPMGIMNKWFFSTNEREYSLSYSSASDRVQFTLSDNGTNVATVSANNFGAISVATWYFIVGVHNSADNTIKIYVNAGTPDSTAHSTGCNNNVSDFEIGIFQGVTQPFDGLIDEAFVYRKALSVEEISWLYNGGAGRAYSELSLVVIPSPLNSTAVGVAPTIIHTTLPPALDSTAVEVTPTIIHTAILVVLNSTAVGNSVILKFVRILLAKAKRTRFYAVAKRTTMRAKKKRLSFYARKKR